MNLMSRRGLMRTVPIAATLGLIASRGLPSSRITMRSKNADRFAEKMFADVLG
jgi:hypothetical protein